MYRQMIFYMLAKAIQWMKVVFTTNGMELLNIHIKWITLIHALNNT